MFQKLIQLPLKKNQTILLSLVLALLLLGLTGLLFYTTRHANKTDNSIQANTTPRVTPRPVKRETQISFLPSTLSAKVGTNLKTSISISTGANKLSGIQFTLKYDPQALQIVDITPGVFFVNPTILLNNINNANGQADYALGSMTPKSGKNTILTLTLKPIAVTDLSGTQITFSNTKVADITAGSNNVLKSTTGLTVIIK